MRRRHSLGARSAVLAVVPLMLMSGCFRATMIDDRLPEGPRHEAWTDFFLFGLVGEEELDVRTYCPSGAVEVRTGGNVGTVLVTVATLGIYAPRKVYIRCALTLPPSDGGSPWEAAGGVR